MLIDVSYFTYGPRQIENASIVKMSAQNSLAVNESINGYIKHYQNLFLASILGNDLVNDFVNYITDNDNKDERYEVVCSKIRDSFADYVFFNMLRDMNRQATITGFVQLKCANTYMSPIKMQVTIWNEMVMKNRLFLEFSKSGNCPFSVNIDNNLLTPINSFNL